jgi:hypothetical protein
MKSPTPFLLVTLLLPLLVHAHGYVYQLSIDGMLYDGPEVAGPAISSGIREVYTIDPIKGALNVNLTCGTVQPGQIASLMLDANPGSEMLIYWGTGNGNVSGEPTYPPHSLLSGVFLKTPSPVASQYGTHADIYDSLWERILCWV